MQPRLTPVPDDEALRFQAVLEGMAKIESLGYQRLAELGATQLKTIRSVGGGAANSRWTAIRLRALGVPGVASDSDHAAMGVARLAWRGIGHAD
jgi:D-ribulokinase